MFDTNLLVLVALLTVLATVAWLRGGEELVMRGFSGGASLLLRFALVILVSFLAAGFVEALFLLAVPLGLQGGQPLFLLGLPGLAGGSQILFADALRLALDLNRGEAALHLFLDLTADLRQALGLVRLPLGLGRDQAFGLFGLPGLAGRLQALADLLLAAALDDCEAALDLLLGLATNLGQALGLGGLPLRFGGGQALVNLIGGL